MQIWIVLYEHRHGTDLWPVTESLSHDEAIAMLREEGAWNDADDKDESNFVEVRGPFEVQAQLPAGLQKLLASMRGHAQHILQLFDEGKFPESEMFEDGVKELCRWTRGLDQQLRNLFDFEKEGAG